MDYLQKILGDIEIHSPEGIDQCFAHGVSPNDKVDGKPLFMEMINMYLRSSRFKDCIKVFVDHGLVYDDKVLLAVLLDDYLGLLDLIRKDPSIPFKRYSLNCTFTPLFEATLLHICAEYNHLEVAKVLVNHGADINSKAGVDQHGFGGQTPIFHTVNQHDNVCIDVLKFLLSQEANLLITVKGLIWGKGYEWETYIPSVNPISYAMMGLLRQFQRTESDIYNVVELLQKEGNGIEYHHGNVPNKYLYKY